MGRIIEKKLPAVFILLLLLMLTAAGCNKGEAPVMEPEETEEKAGVVEAFGTVEVKNISALTIDFAAAVKQLDAEEGQLITAGQVLAVLDMSDIESSIRQHDFEIQKLQNELQTKQLLYETNKKDLERRKELLNAGALTAREVEEYETALSQVAGEMKSLEILIAKAGADKARLQNQLSNKGYLDGSNLVSPFEQGLVSEVNCYEGDIISTPRSLMSIMDLKSIYIEAEIPEEFIGEIKTDAKVIIVPVADSSKEYHGRVVKISNIAQNRDGETIIPVEIAIEDYDEFLKPKYNVDVKITTD
jgi:HlyD family secretion protein